MHPSPHDVEENELQLGVATSGARPSSELQQQLELGDAELVVEGDRAPKGWRIDRFGTRTVSVPPWSRRPPKVLPEAWLTFSKNYQNELREELRKEDPEGFEA